jgi:hypothetical protein
MTCLEALLDVMDSFGFSLIFIDLGGFQARRLGSLRHRTAANGSEPDGSRTPLTTSARLLDAGGF